MVAAVAFVALSTAGCLKTGGAEMTGGVDPQVSSPGEWRRQADSLGRRFEANPGDAATALAYARALKGLDQKAQAAAVLEQAALRSPENADILAAYGKALADVGRYKEASEVLSRAHSPERPDWRILSAQGAVADQRGDHALAQKYYEAALKIVPDEPTVLSNLGLSYALTKRLPEAESTLRRAAAGPKADGRVRQNLALVLGLEGKLAEAEAVLKQDLTPEEASANLAVLQGLAGQPSGEPARRAEKAPGKSPRV
jgi:Flp pilus assembly protein TadD